MFQYLSLQNISKPFGDRLQPLVQSNWAGVGASDLREFRTLAPSPVPLKPQFELLQFHLHGLTNVSIKKKNSNTYLVWKNGARAVVHHGHYFLSRVVRVLVRLDHILLLMQPLLPPWHFVRFHHLWYPAPSFLPWAFHAQLHSPVLPGLAYEMMTLCCAFCLVSIFQLAIFWNAVAIHLGFWTRTLQVCLYHYWSPSFDRIYSDGISSK